MPGPAIPNFPANALPLKEWIDRYGRHALAERLGVTIRAVNMWAQGHSAPRIDTIMRIIALSENTISFEDVVAGTTWRTKALWAKRREKRESHHA
jgi:transcriptional regulator with XRE-family HTH domain